jgi:hypothetical protein
MIGPFTWRAWGKAPALSRRLIVSMLTAQASAASVRPSSPVMSTAVTVMALTSSWCAAALVSRSTV